MIWFELVILLACLVVGAVVNEAALTELLAQLEQSVSLGAEIVCGVYFDDGEGAG